MKTRSQNELGPYINGSTCHFIWQSSSLPDTSIDSPFQIKSRSNQHVLSYPHAWGDAFSGLLKLSALKINPDSNFHSKSSGTLDSSFSYVHWSRIANKNNADQSLTQTFLLSLLLTFKNDFRDGLSFAVSLDDLNQLDQSQVPGNSLAIVELPFDTALKFSALNKKNWKEMLYQRAIKTQKILVNKPQLIKSNASSVLLSSVGDLSRYTWCPSFGPHQLIMLPTPKNIDSANVVIWCGASHQGLSICAHSSHWTMKKSDQIFNLWQVL